MNLLPCLGKICKREDEGIQETLMLTMQKISPALMVFANDTEIKVSRFEPPRGKTNNVVSKKVRHKPACTVTEDG